MEQSAFVLRILPSGIDRMPEALAADQLIIGWSEAAGLLDTTLDWERFREIIRVAYYEEEENLRRVGAAAGHMWRFIREMAPDDLVVVPYGPNFHVAKVTGDAVYDEAKLDDDTAYRRPVLWLNGKKPMPRNLARSALLSRMKTQGTCAYATDLLAEIEECLRLAGEISTPSFEADLQARLIRETLAELRGGRMDSYKFERLIQTVLIGLGAEEARIIPRNLDKGADIVATFRVAGAFRQMVAVQAKHWQPAPAVGADVIRQLIAGIEAEEADLGMVITSGSIDADAAAAAEKYASSRGTKIELVDGEQFAKLIVKHGICRAETTA